MKNRFASEQIDTDCAICPTTLLPAKRIDCYLNHSKRPIRCVSPKNSDTCTRVKSNTRLMHSMISQHLSAVCLFEFEEMKIYLELHVKMQNRHD